MNKKSTLSTSICTFLMIGLALFAPKLIKAQNSRPTSKNVDHETFYWIRYKPTFKFANNWSLVGEIEARRWAFDNRQHQLLVPRFTFLKRLPNGWSVGAGGVVFLQSLPQDGDLDIQLNRPELRPHQELTMREKLGRAGLSHRYRVEQRFRKKSDGDELQDGFDFNWRFRYRLQFRIPLNDKSGAGAMDFKVGDEIMINAGNDVVRNTFDQNRFYVGLRHKFSNKTSLEPTFINWFQQRGSGDDFRSRYILRITFNHSF